MTARTPERDGTTSPAGAEPPADDRPAGSREVRRRLTFGVAGDLADLPAALSPWQRAYEAWRTAGLPWGHGEPPRERGAEPPAGRGPEAPKSRNAIRAVVRPGTPRPGSDAESEHASADEAESVKTAAEPVPGEAATAEEQSEEQVPEAGGRRPRRPRVVIAGAAGLVLVAGGVLFAVEQQDDGPKKPAVPGAVAAGGLFAADPAAATDGLVQDLAVVAASGRTVVAAGTEGDGTPGRERARFLVSADGGSAWRVAKVRGADGAEPPAGERPRLVAAGAGSWLALGRSPLGTVVWLSDGARTWTRHLDTTAFKPGDQVNALVATAHGYVAAGSAGGRAVEWSTADGRVWQRIDALQAGVTGLDRLAASGNVLVAHGTYTRKVARKKGKKKVTRTVRGDGLWRSADGGRTWRAVNVPQAQGSYGATNGLVAGPGGFATVREGRRTTGKKKHRKTTRFGVLFTSPDGVKWRAAGRFSVPGYAGVERFGGSAAGFGVLAKGPKGRRTVLRSTDGRAWRPGGTVESPVASSGLAVAAGGAVVVSGHQGGDAYLSGVNLAAVPGAVHAERTIASLAAGSGGTVAVGSTSGDAAVWVSPDGRAWKRGQVPVAGGRLAGVAFGKQGWLAVGGTSGPRPGALAMTSPDGTVWQRARIPAAPLTAVASGPSGYVAVGGGAVWRSADLKAWKRAPVDGNLAGVVASGTRYVAVGGRAGKPAVWTSPDGAVWRPVNVPAAGAPQGAGPLTEVAARGNALVATGAGGQVLVSADGGATWTRRPPAGAREATAVTATPQGFVLGVATARGDAAVFASADGTAWRRVPVPGLGGRGDQRLTALAAAGGTVLGVGTSTRDGAETPLLWRASARWTER